MPDLPTGVVTFMLTDVEGSTRLWEESPEAMTGSLERHDALATQAVEAVGGIVVKSRGEGDSIFAVFDRPRDAVDGALRMQLAFEAEPWPEGAALRVRTGIHTGEVTARDGDYFGPTVNRAGRLRAAAHGGQVILSQTTADLVAGDLPAGSWLVDLGSHRLRDLTRHEHVWQLAHEGLSRAFPPLTTMDARHNNIPAAPTPLIGRSVEVQLAVDWICSRDVRLLTIIGPAGAGKTRVATHAAAEALESFDGGAWFVNLAGVSDHRAVAGVIAQAVDAREEPGLSPLRAAGAVLGRKPSLLVVDNFEQVIDAATDIAELLAACPALTVMVTSREPLRIRGEHELPLELLDVPRHDVDLDELRASPALTLFIDRARAVRPDLSLDEATVRIIARICARLEGLPLAIELAAARVRSLAPETILDRLDKRLTLLTGGPRDLPERHRALRDAILWSYELLDEPERRLLAWASVFAGAFSLDAAESVCEGSGAEVIGALTSLVDKSLIRSIRGGRDRFAMLATIREFASDELGADARAASDAHAAWCRSLARAAADTIGTAGAAGVDLVAEADLDVCAALDHLAQTGQEESFCEMVAAMTGPWLARGSLTEALDRATAAVAVAPTPVLRARSYFALARAARACGQTERARDAVTQTLEALDRSDGSDADRAAAVNLAGIIAESAGDARTAERSYEEALRLRTAVGDGRAAGETLNNLGALELAAGRLDRARARFEGSLAAGRAAGDERLCAAAMNNLGAVLLEDGDATGARVLFADCRNIRQRLGDRVGSAEATGNLGVCAEVDGDLELAVALHAESLEIRRECGDLPGCVTALVNLGVIERARGDRAASKGYLVEALGCAPDEPQTIEVVEQLGVSVGADARSVGAVLLGFADAERSRLGLARPQADVTPFEEALAAVRAAPGGVDRLNQGSVMTMDEVTAFARHHLGQESGVTPSNP